MTDYGPYTGPWPDDSGAPGCHLFGWMSPVELDWLHDRAAEARSVAEVGSFKGRSTFALLTGCKGKVYSIDPHHPVNARGAIDPTAEWGSSWPEFNENVGHFKNLVVVRDSSPAAAASVPSVDFTFIDGDHTEEGLTADLEAWIPKTRKLIAGHDYDHAMYPAVTPVVQAFFDADRINVISGIWWVDV